MITAIFNPGDKSITTEKLLQWDYGQVLSIKGLDLPKAVEIHFCVYTDSTTITTVGITTDDHTDVEIPDGLLRQDRELRAYVYVADLEQGKTVRTVNIPIQSRQKPEIPHTPEDTEVFREAIKAVNESADRAETAADTSEQNAKKTAEDRTAIEEMVETVSGIEQQVQDVKKYAGQAETAASNAALSEQKAKESENAALQAKADADTAKGSAETAAGKTAEDRMAVERAKEEALQAKQQVSTDREAVEAVERKVAQMGNAIPQAVLEGVQAVGNAGAAEKQGIVQAGTEQKSAVESAGTKAIENINLAKKSATDAVETAKTGAVGAVGTAGTEQTRNVTAEGEKQVKAVADKGAEVLQSIPEDFTVQMQNKLDKQQGIENKGKALVVGDDGNVVVGEVTGGDGIPIINTASGESPLVVSDSAERVNKGFGLGGNTLQNQDPPPSPDNPQEIKNVGKWNAETQKYEVDVKITGKNLFDIEKARNKANWLQSSISVGYSDFLVHVGAAKKIIVSSNAKLASGLGFFLGISQGTDKSTHGWIYHSTASYKESITIFPTNNYIVVRCISNGIDKFIEYMPNFQIEISGMQTSYEPYKEQTITLTSDRPITKWDKLVEKDGEIGWLYNEYQKYTFDGNELWFKDGDLLFFTKSLQRVIKTDIGICEILSFEDNGRLGGENNYRWSGAGFFELFNLEGRKTSEEIQGWIKGLKEKGINLTIFLQGNETKFVPLQQSEQDAIRALRTYYPTTVIAVDSGEVDPDVELTYTADTKNFILNREKVMQAQMLNIQSALISSKISGGGIKITDSSRLPVEEFAMQGKLEQMQTTGANLFDEKKLLNFDDPNYDKSSANKGVIYYKIKTNEQVTVSVAKLNKDGEYLCVGAESDGSDAYWLSHKSAATNTFRTLAPKDGYIYLGVNSILERVENMIRKTGGIMINHGSVTMPYEPYTGGKPSPSPDFPQPIETTPQGVITVDFTDGTNHQTVELNCPREFTKWDKLQKTDGVWNWVFQSKKIDLSTPEDDGYDRAWYYNNNNSGVCFSYIAQDKKGGNQSSVCETFKNVDLAYTGSHKSEFGIYCDHPDIGIKHFFFRPPNESIITLDNWKDWLKSNNLVVIFETENAIEKIPLSQSEQDKLNAITMYAPNTEITNTGGCNMELTYTVDTKSYVDAKIASVVKTILETQKALL